LIRSLKNKEYIFIRTEGMPPTRWMKINWKKLQEQSIELHDELQEKRNKRTQRVGIAQMDSGSLLEEDDDVPFEEE
jgi:hypothetical protein